MRFECLSHTLDQCGTTERWLVAVPHSNLGWEQGFLIQWSFRSFSFQHHAYQDPRDLYIGCSSSTEMNCSFGPFGGTICSYDCVVLAMPYPVCKDNVLRHVSRKGHVGNHGSSNSTKGNAILRTFLFSFPLFFPLIERRHHCRNLSTDNFSRARHLKYRIWSLGEKSQVQSSRHCDIMNVRSL